MKERMKKEIKREEERKRSAKNSHYIMKNGEKRIEAHAEDVNYYDEKEKKWKEIDNSLVEGEDCYEAGLGKYKVKLSKPENSERISVGNESGRAITWEYLGKEKPDNAQRRNLGRVKGKKISELRTETSFFPGSKKSNSSRAIYENAEGGIDLDYRISGSSIKENIVVKSKSGEYKYYFSLDVKGFELTLSEEKKQLEFYRTDDRGKREDNIPEFIMPSPFMYAADGRHSDEVYYSIEPCENSGKYIFSVIADAEWINAEGRKLPVVIDPQLIAYGDNIITVRHTRYVNGNSVGCSDDCCDYCDCCTESLVYNYIHIEKYGEQEVRAAITINKAAVDTLDTPDDNISSVKLRMRVMGTNAAWTYLPTCTGISSGETGIVDTYDSETGEIIANITELYKDAGDKLTLTFRIGVDNVYVDFYMNPTIEVTYTSEYADSRLAMNSIPLVGGTEIAVNCNNGESLVTIPCISDAKLGTDIFLVYKKGNTALCGNNFRLNLEESLVKDTASGNYIYTNEYGEEFTTNKRYYFYTNQGVKKYMDSLPYVKISVNDYGVMEYNGARVYTENYLADGSEVYTVDNDVDLSIKLDNYPKELSEVEEQLNQYESVLREFVVVNGDYSVTSRFENYITGNYGYISDLESKISSCRNSIGDDVTNKIYLFTKSQLESILQGQSITESDTDEDDKSDTDEDDIGEKLDDISEANCEHATEYLKRCATTGVELNKRKLVTPINMLRSGSVIKGYNSEGDLVMIAHADGRSVRIERDLYALANASTTRRITRISDEAGNAITFTHELKRKYIESITDSTGSRVDFGYGMCNGIYTLTDLNYNNGEALTIGYTSGIILNKITSSESKKYAALSLAVNETNDMYIASEAAIYSTVSSIRHGKSTVANGKKIASTVITAVDGEAAEIKQPDHTAINVLGYEFKDGMSSDDDRIVVRVERNHAYTYKIVNGIVVEAKRECYVALRKKAIEYASKTTLHKSSLEDFIFVPGESEVCELNDFNEPKKITRTGIVVSEAATETQITEYNYDTERRLASTVTESRITTKTGKVIEKTIITKYYYDGSGRQIRKESYIAGEELITGITVEEHLFNENGYETGTVKYNSLDTGTKFYTERELDEKGRVVANIDETGEYKTSFEYEADGVTVKSERLANKSRYSYGRDAAGRMTAISHSTESGEENSTVRNYTSGCMTELRSGNNVTRYTYDEKGRVTSLDLNDTPEYITYTYSGDHTNEKITTAIMKDGTEKKTVKDKHGNITQSSVDGLVVTNEYDERNNLTLREDNAAGTSEVFTYDSADNLTRVSVNGTDTEKYTYGNEGELTRKEINGRVYTYGYKTDRKVKEIESISTGGITVTPETDVNGRNTGKTVSVNNVKIAEEQIAYLKFGDHATSLPSTVRFGNSVNGRYVVKDGIKYKYDGMGNITEVYENGLPAAKYEYDALGRLKREDSRAFDKTVIYSYDDNGNILARYEYGLTSKTSEELKFAEPTSTVIYSYDNDSDRLISCGGEEFEYDDIGNPIKYRGMDAEWTHGRRLTKLVDNKGDNDEANDITTVFEYDARGRRTAKNDITYTYDSVGNLLSQSNGLEFIYDHTGVFAVKHNNTTYFYRKNTQQDIIALLDATGNVVAKYAYDAWGNHKVVDSSGVEITDSNNIANLNPFRYRSYYYDTETNLYYLKTRYYDPKIGRFITIDDITYLLPDTINGLNLYAYCGNNPVMRKDDSGQFWNIIVGAVIGLGMQFVSDLVASAIEGEFSVSHWSTYVGAAVGGAVGSIIPGSCILGEAVGAAVSTVVSDVAYNIESAIIGSDEYYSAEQIFYDTVNNTAVAAMSAFGFEQSKIGSKLMKTNVQIAKKIGLKVNLGDLFRGLLTSVFSGIFGVMELPNTHIWDVPRVERSFFR